MRCGSGVVASVWQRLTFQRLLFALEKCQLSCFESDVAAVLFLSLKGIVLPGLILLTVIVVASGRGSWWNGSCVHLVATTVASYLVIVGLFASHVFCWISPHLG